MIFPESIERYLQSKLLDSKHPLCLQIDTAHRLVDIWGEVEHYDLEGLAAGQDVSLAVPFLDAGSNEHVVELPFITDEAGRVFHAHLIPAAHGCYVVYLDAREELKQRQLSQQAANEVKLLLERERRIIDELVDSKAEVAVRRAEAEEQSRRRGEYIATMSHEFRTPLTGLLAHAERLANSTTRAEIEAAADAIRRITHQNLWLIDNLLTNARLEADGFAIHDTVTDLRALVNDLSLVFAPLAADRELAFAAYVAENVPPFVVIDDLHLRQVLVNLLSNAIKYTEAGAVGVEIALAQGRLRATVSDTGTGISAQELTRLFRPFERGRQVPRTLSAGLGLSITKALVEAMNGKLELESEVDRGTRAVVDLPVRVAAQQPRVDDPVRRPLVLVGEDDPDLADLMALRLAEAGYDVAVVGDGEAVVARALTSHPDLVIIDTNMPHLDGPNAARTLRERGFAAPILALSAANQRRDIERALASGCTEFLRKPAHPDVLKRVVAQLVLSGHAKR